MSIDLTGLAEGIGISTGALLIVAIGTGIAIYYIQRRMKNDKKRIQFITLSVLGAVLLIGISGGFLKPGENGVTVTEKDIGAPFEEQAWQSTYKFIANEKLVDYSSRTTNTDYYDYNEVTIEAAAHKIAKESSSASEAIDKTLDYVYRKVEYISGEADVACFDGTAPTILASGEGQCDTQSITVIAILRKMGIAAQPVGGCIVQNPSCRLQAIFQSIGIFRTPQYSEIEIVSEEQDIFSRAAEERSPFSRTGGLHAYVVAWVPEEGWIVLEPTTGLRADTKCYYYHVELYPLDSQKTDICISQNWHYAKACQISDLDSLDKYGVGIANEVPPK